MLIAVNRMHRPEEVLERIRQAINRRQPLSLIRLASGEAFTLAHNSLLPVAKIPWWVVYAGVVLPNEAARRDLIQAVKEGDIVGLSPDRSRWECAPLLEQAFNLYRLRPHYITTAIVNWALHREDALYRLIKDVPTIVIGRRAAEAAPCSGPRESMWSAPIIWKAIRTYPVANGKSKAGPSSGWLWWQPGSLPPSSAPAWPGKGVVLPLIMAMSSMI